MPAGTIALTNGSNAVTGTGTSFTTELKQGDFVYVTVGSAPYTLVVSSVVSNTQLTLSVAFDGPTTSGLAWNAVPASMQVAITQKILNDFAQVARGRILDFQNWQKIYSSDQSVTVTRPDRTQFTGPSWGYMATNFAGKANTDDVLTKADNLSSLTDKATARTNLGLGDLATSDGPLAINKGGTGSATPFGAAANTFAQGNDSRLNTVDQKSGGTITSALGVTGNVTSTATTYNYVSPVASATTSGSTKTNLFALAYVNSTQYYIQDAYLDTGDVYSRITVVNGSGSSIFYFGAGGTGQAKTAWTTYSDRRVKTDIEVIQNALDKVSKLNGYTYKKFGQKQTGVIAQEVQEVLPEAITVFGSLKLESGETIEDVLSISPGDLTGLLIEATKELSDKILKQDSVISELQKRMKSIDGLDA